VDTIKAKQLGQGLSNLVCNYCCQVDAHCSQGHCSKVKVIVSINKINHDLLFQIGQNFWGFFWRGMCL
jgi:hypothetical protein